jgi:hypothetical protein
MIQKTSPKSAPTAGYIGIHQLSFGPPTPNGIGTPIPKTNNGNTSIGMFSKLSKLMPSGLVRKVINTQQNRF